MKRQLFWAACAVSLCLFCGGDANADLKKITNDGVPGNPEVVSSNPEGVECMQVTFHTLVSGSSPQAMTQFTVTNAQGGEYTITMDPWEPAITLECEWVDVQAEELGEPTPNPEDPENPTPSQANCHVFWRPPGT